MARELTDKQQKFLQVLFDDAYGVAVQREIESRCNRKITISTVHSVLSRLEDKGFMNPRYDGATPERGGRRKHLFTISIAGQKVLEEARLQRNSMWAAIPKMALSKS